MVSYRRLAWALASAWTALLLTSGCLAHRETTHVGPQLPLDYTTTTLEIEQPNVEVANYEKMGGPARPRSVRDHASLTYRDTTLEEAIKLALEHSRVMIDLGGTILRFPESVPTTYDPAAQETNPQFGVEAALSAFDANFATSLLCEKNDRRYNNQFVGDLGFFDQEYDVFQAEITKRAVTGSQFAVREIIDFDHNNNLGNQFRGGAWDVSLEGELRHPLLRGGGVEFNRIAGTSGQVGIYNGVLIARMRTDISLADFEMGVRNLMSNVENAYWDLYFAYRDLDTKVRARDTALETWRRVQALYRTGRRGGEAEKEAQAREQFLRFESEVQNALVGRALENTQTNNGSSPGTFRGVPGVYMAERRLRLIMGLPPNEEYLIRPSDEPPTAPVIYDWSTIATEALVEREELRRQRWEVKRREMELLASKNYMLPNLDFVARYRWRGFGEKLLNSDRANLPQFDNAFMDLTSGDFQEWQMGMEFNLPIGFRQGHAAVRNAQLRLAQSIAVLREQELQIMHDLSTAASEVDRAYTVLQTEINRVIAAKQQLDALQAAYDSDKAEFFVVLDSQRRFAEAEERYHQARVEYGLSLRNVHFEKGSLLAYCGVMLNEGPSPTKAYVDAARREKQRLLRPPINYSLSRRTTVSLGPVPPADRGMPLPQLDTEIPAAVTQPPYPPETWQGGHEAEQVAPTLGIPPPLAKRCSRLRSHRSPWPRVI